LFVHAVGHKGSVAASASGGLASQSGVREVNVGCLPERFAFARYKLGLRAEEPIRLGRFFGSTLRGGFGHAFKRTVCLWERGDCRRCQIREQCVYSYVFETPRPSGSDRLRTIDQIPRPYVIEPPAWRQFGRLIDRGERLEFGLVLIGRAIEQLPYFLLAYQRLGQLGLGPERGRFWLDRVLAAGLDGDEQTIYDGRSDKLSRQPPPVSGKELNCQSWLDKAVEGCELTVRFLTPTRIKSGGRIVREPTFQEFVRGLLRRLSSLCYFHCGVPLEVDFGGLIERSGAVGTVESRLSWYGQGRFSGRQHQWVDMSGVVGVVRYAGGEPALWRELAPLIEAGRWVHIGKGAVMGLGKYEVEVGD